MRAVPPRLVRRSMLAPRFSSILTISRWPLVAATCSRPLAAVLPSGPLVQPLDHLLQLASPSRIEETRRQRGGRAPHGLASVRWGGRRGGGRLRRRCVLPEELCCGRLALDLGPLQSCALVQLVGVGPDQQQSVHAPQHPGSSSRGVAPPARACSR
eukprot:scaffold22058_cov73-Phaeocystis_antarctica.AAC.2